MKKINNKKILLELLNTYALTTGDAACYSGYSKDYFYQMKMGTRRVTEPVLTKLYLGLKHVYQQLSNLDVDMSQDLFDKKLKEYHVYTRHLCKILNATPATITSRLYHIRNNILRDSIFKKLISKLTIESKFLVQEINNKYKTLLI